MCLAATQLQDKRQADKRCVKGHLYITIIFLWPWQVHILHHASNYSADGLWKIDLENALVQWMTKPTEANFPGASCQLRAKLPVFCKHTVRTIIGIKK
jgi:hypothetical protein